eukprot:scaffold73926_cov45-Phaeocystis_antarctica.AAC.1
METDYCLPIPPRPPSSGLHLLARPPRASLYLPGCPRLRAAYQGHAQRDGLDAMPSQHHGLDAGMRLCMKRR